MELKRQPRPCSTGSLRTINSIAGDEYTIADMAIWPWYGNGVLNGASYNDPRKFLQTHEYKKPDALDERNRRASGRQARRTVNRATGPPGRAIARTP